MQLFFLVGIMNGTFFSNYGMNVPDDLGILNCADLYWSVKAHSQAHILSKLLLHLSILDHLFWIKQCLHMENI